MIKYLQLSGSPFHIGMALGEFSAPILHKHIVNTQLWKNLTAWRDSSILKEMQTLVQQQHPYIWDELQGIAKGAQIPAEDIFLWNSRSDLIPIINGSSTTVMQIAQGTSRITHNEDGDPALKDYCAIAEIEIPGHTSFASFIQPGSLPGNSFSVTESNMAIIVNYLKINEPQSGVPTMVLNRSLIEAADISQAIQQVQQAPRSGNCHLTIGQIGKKSLMSIEFTSNKASVENLNSISAHTNHIVHKQMKDESYKVSQSSAERLQTANRWIAGAESVDALALMADQSHESLPIYRNDPVAPDGEHTIVNVDIQINTDEILWDVREHPMEAPIYKMRGIKHF